MKLLQLSHSDINGGAARAAYRLHQGLQITGVTSKMLVQDKSSIDKTVTAPNTRLSESIARMRLSIDVLPLKLYSQRNNQSFSSQWVPDTVVSKLENINPDIIHLHWINQAFIQIETLAKFKLPLVWTLHDMWAFTGGCHYNQECDRYTISCGTCPQLNSNRELDLSRWVWKRKAKAWKDLNITIVTPSKWLAKCASKSSLFKGMQIKVIPYGLDTKIYRKIDKQIARKLLHLPDDKQILIFGALQATSDKRKGFELLQAALNELSKSGVNQNLELAIFGASKPESSIEFGFKSHYLGTLNDDLTLALAYCAADVFVAPSLQDNLPNTVLEAIACGTPCVAFNIGGMPDMIEHQKNGYLAKPYKIEDLAQGIAWILENKERHQKLSYNARYKTEQEFALEIQARRYFSLYTEVVNSLNHQNCKA